MSTLTRRAAVRSMATVIAAAVWGCGSRGRVEPVWAGQDECAYCRMMIDDISLATQFVAPSGDRNPFGEVGCMLSWLAAHPDRAGDAWITPRDGGGWVLASAAAYQIGESRTPMRFDITAHASWSAAPLTWEALRAKGAPDVRSS